MAAKPVRLPYMNYAAFTGRLTADPDLRYTPSGTAVLDFRIAVNKRTKSSVTGDWQDDVSFFGVKVWRATAEYCSKKLHKGSAVIVSGEMRTESWEKDGEKRSFVYLSANQCQVLDIEEVERQLGTPAGEPEEKPEEAGKEDDALPF